MRRACVAAGFEPRIAFIPRDPLHRGLVAGGLAVTLAPASLAEHLPGIRAVPVAPDPPRRVT